MEKLAALVVWALILGGVYGIAQLAADDDGSAGVTAGAPAPGAGAQAASDMSHAVEGGAVHPAEVVDESQPHSHDDAGASIDDRGFADLANGEQHGHEFTQAVSPEDRKELSRQLALTREVALQYPTVADAEAAGLHRAGPFAPGLGAHYISYGNAMANTDGVMSDDDIRKPLAWIYDGVEPDSPVAGLFYMTVAKDAEGFAGPNDTWHVHHNVCIKAGKNGVIDSPLGADAEVTEEQCAAVGGNLLKQTQYLLHVWTVPGYESPEGVFSHLSSAVTCADGTYEVIADITKIGTRTTACADGVK
jgi:hypothetical protein